jgi:hypothetical protein
MDAEYMMCMNDFIFRNQSALREFFDHLVVRLVLRLFFVLIYDVSFESVVIGAED